MNRLPTTQNRRTMRITAFLPCRAFTRTELLATLTASVLLTITVGPMLANSRKATEQAACAGNLERIGQAWQSWLAEHSGQLPFRRTPSEGGLMSTLQVQNAFRTFQYLSNHLASPADMICPADVGTTMRATNWAVFETSHYRGNALSYTVGTDALVEVPLATLHTDRHLVWTELQNCSVGAVTMLLSPTNANVGWVTNASHGDVGNVLRMDGSVVSCNSAGLRARVVDTNDDFHGLHHLLLPR